MNTLSRKRTTAPKRISTAAKLKKTAAWQEFSRYIRNRDNYTCVTCGRKDESRNMHAGHFIQASGRLILFFDETNVNAQCIGCNLYMSGNLIKYSLFIREKYGETYDKELIKKALEYKHNGYSKKELKEIKDKYETLNRAYRNSVTCP